ncbi:MAG: NfeD family protein [Eubacterium sp.]|nr:NfeD family protein [Eubacterium sp.]
MAEWWNTLELAQQIFYCIAVPSTLIIIIQAILIMIGMGSGGEGINFSDTSGLDGGLDVGFDGGAGAHGAADLDFDISDGSNPADFGAMQIFTMQGIMAFLCVFSWSGIVCLSLKLHIALAVIIGLVLGFLAMLGVAKIIQLTARLAQNGNIDVKKLLGEKGSVYIPIPSAGGGQGKVTIIAGERFVEMSAVTDQDITIPTGAPVRVTDIRGDVLVVEKDT